MPGLGGMCVFDRSWYGRVLVERVEGFATEQQWRRAYEVIVGFERIARDRGHASSSSSGCTSATRSSSPGSGAARTIRFKRWKLTEEDWRNRGSATATTTAPPRRCSPVPTTSWPWDVVAAEQKRYARIAVLERLNERIEEGMRRFDMAIPDPDPA